MYEGACIHTYLTASAATAAAQFLAARVAASAATAAATPRTAVTPRTLYTSAAIATLTRSTSFEIASVVSGVCVPSAATASAAACSFICDYVVLQEEGMLLNDLGKSFEKCL